VALWQRAPGGSLSGAIRRGTDGFTEPVNPRVSPIRQSPPAVTGASTLWVETRVVTGRTTLSGATGFSPRPASSVDPTVGAAFLSPGPCLSRRDGVFYGSRRVGRHVGRP